MATTIQLTEIPQNETVANRVFTLDRKGGDFGSSFECTIQLPDRSGQVSAVHGRFVANKHRMNIEAVNGNKISVNGTLLASGRMVTIEDGTVIQVADYMMLVSQIGDENTVQAETTIPPANAHFTLSGLESNDVNEDLVMKNDRQDSLENYEKSQQQTPHFSANGVFSDDPFEDDPFEDETICLKHEEQIPKNTLDGENIQFDKPTNDTLDSQIEVEPVYVDKSFSKNKTAPLEQSNVSSTKVDQLVNLLGSQIVSANQQQANLLNVIDKTLTTFLEEFSPQHLEDIYEDFAVPFFVQKEKQYWLTHRKSFTRRLKKGEYHRLFKALLIENMQNKD